MNDGLEPASAPPGLDVASLFAEQGKRVYSFALRMLGNEDSARDVVQETFAIVLDKADSFRGESAALTWILSITKNLCLKRLTGSRERSFSDIEAIVDANALPPSVERSEDELRFYIEEVKKGCLVGLLQCLPFAQRCVFILHLLGDIPIATVASIMRKSENSIRILLSRARSSMRSFLCANCSLMTANAGRSGPRRPDRPRRNRPVQPRKLIGHLLVGSIR